MVIYDPNEKGKQFSNKKFQELEGYLDEQAAKESLAEFLYANLGFTVRLLTGIELFPYQEIILRHWFDNNFNMNVISRGGSKTISYNSGDFLLEKERGLITLKQLFPNVDFSEEKWADIDPIQLWNGDKWVNVSKLLIQPKKRCLTLTTKNGYKITGSENHILKCLNSKGNNCNIFWGKSKELRVGDHICISRNNVDWEKENKISNDEAYLAGLAIGDGCFF